MLRQSVRKRYRWSLKGERFMSSKRFADLVVKNTVIGKKILGIIAVMFFITILSLKVIDLYLAKVPNFDINKAETNIKVKKGSYCWEAILSGICTDIKNPEDMLEGIEPTNVKFGDTLILDFSKKPNSIRVTIYESNSSLDYDVESGLLKVPGEKGVYIVNVLGSWDRGYVQYVFTIGLI